MATQNAKGADIEQKTALLRNGGKSPESSWSASVFLQNFRWKLALSGICQLQINQFLRKVGQSGICELAVFDLILQLSVFLRD
jgi:hypothetical protein